MIENRIALSLPRMELAFPTETLAVLCVAHVINATCATHSTVRVSVDTTLVALITQRLML